MKIHEYEHLNIEHHLSAALWELNNVSMYAESEGMIDEIVQRVRKELMQLYISVQDMIDAEIDYGNKLPD